MTKKRVIIDVPESWIIKLGEVSFRRQLEAWLWFNAPCDECWGEGFYQPGNHLSDLDEVGCPKCGAKAWENPL